MTQEFREELRRIQSELKEVFPPEIHEIREIPGGKKKWVYLPWQVVRERLDQVVPDWQSDHLEIQYLGNDAICRSGLTIMGVRKEAIACVPISAISGNGNQMTRGSACDRLAAEALKNSAEAWGVGRYLDDQEFTIRYLWDSMTKLDDAMCGQIRALSEAYKQEFKKAASVPPKTKNQPQTVLISEEKARQLWAISRQQLKLSDDQTKKIILGFGYNGSMEIPVDKYNLIISKLRQFAITDKPK